MGGSCLQLDIKCVVVVVTIGAGEPAGGPASPFASPTFAGGDGGGDICVVEVESVGVANDLLLVLLPTLGTTIELTEIMTLLTCRKIISLSTRHRAIPRGISRLAR